MPNQKSSKRTRQTKDYQAKYDAIVVRIDEMKKLVEMEQRDTVEMPCLLLKVNAYTKKNENVRKSQ